jgi:hypothetical protein
MRCKLPGPQLPAQTASSPVRCASAPAAKQRLTHVRSRRSTRWGCRRQCHKPVLTPAAAGIFKLIGHGFCHAELLLARITRQEVYGTQILHAIASRRQRHEENVDAGVEAIEQHIEEYADRKCGQLERLPRLFSYGKAPSRPHHVMLVDRHWVVAEPSVLGDRREEVDGCKRFRTRK